MVRVNLFMWLAMVGAMFRPEPDHRAKWTAVAGVVLAALWDHFAVRGYLKSKKQNPSAAPAAR
jgi:hypothetical protein